MATVLSDQVAWLANPNPGPSGKSNATTGQNAGVYRFRATFDAGATIASGDKVVLAVVPAGYIPLAAIVAGGMSGAAGDIYVTGRGAAPDVKIGTLAGAVVTPLNNPNIGNDWTGSNPNGNPPVNLYDQAGAAAIQVYLQSTASANLAANGGNAVDLLFSAPN